MSVGKKRERLLDWIKNGDPDDVPVLFGPGPEIAASYLGKTVSEVTCDDVIRIAEETGTHNIACLHNTPEIAGSSPSEFTVGLKVQQLRETLPDGTPKIGQRFETPEGTLTCSEILSAHMGTCPSEYLVKDEADLAALTWLLDKERRIYTDRMTKRQLTRQFAKARNAAGNVLPTLIGMTPPAMTLMIYPYMDKETALFLVHDQPGLMKQFMEWEWEKQKIWLESAAENSVDIYRIAINGLEWLSPGLYVRYMIPQTRRIAEFAATHGKLSWVHTCRKLKRLAKTGVYNQMGVDVVESLSTPPTGDINDMKITRRHIGARTTRGGINNEYLYTGDTQAIVQQTQYVLDSVAGHRHMLGDTNPPSPPYPRESIEAVINVVRSRGQLFE